MFNCKRSDLVRLMLNNGFNYVLAEVLDQDKDFDKFEGNVVVINGFENGYFQDVEGDNWLAAQPIKANGAVMTYNDYIELSKLI